MAIGGNMKKLWRKCKHCNYSNYIESKDEKPFKFRCERCSKETETAEHLSTLKAT